jgi:hypothetical protein
VPPGDFALRLDAICKERRQVEAFFRLPKQSPKKSLPRRHGSCGTHPDLDSATAA